jgi:hypothetical protein
MTRDQLEHAIADLVAVVIGLEFVAGRLLDELHGQLELRGFDLRLVDGHLRERPQFLFV